MQRRLSPEPGAVRIQADVETVEASLPVGLAVRAVQEGRKIDTRSFGPDRDRAVGQRLDMDGEIGSLAQPQPVQRAFEEPGVGDIETGPAGKFQTRPGSGDRRRFEQSVRPGAKACLQPGGLAGGFRPAQTLQLNFAGSKARLHLDFGCVVPVLRCGQVDLDGAAHIGGEPEAETRLPLFIEGRAQPVNGFDRAVARKPLLDVECRRLPAE